MAAPTEYSLDDLYLMITSIYSEQNSQRSLSSTFSHFVEVCGMLAMHDRKKKREEIVIEDALCKSLGWFFPLLAKCRVRSVEDLIFRKYPYACPYCRKCPHKDPHCKTTQGTKNTVDHKAVQLAYTQNHAKRPRSLNGWQQMFNEIYERDVNTLGTARSTLGLLEEIGEMAEAVRVFEKYPKYFAGEAADVFSYIMGIANEHNIRLQLDSKPTMDFEAEFLRRYPGLCLQCGHEICVCPSVPESTVGRLSKELDLMPSEQIFALELPEAERRGREIGDSVLEGLGGLAALTLKLPLDRGETNRAMTVLCMKLSDEMRGQNASLANELQDAAIRIATDVRRPGSRSHGEASAHAVELLAGVWPLLSSAVIPDDNSLPSRLGRLFRTQSARIGIITALPKEFAAMRMMLDEQCMNPIASDPNDYVVGTIPAFDGTGNHVVVLTLLKDMGNNTAAAAATHLLRSFPAVEDVIMVGIAGGIPAPESPQAHVRLGDIVVSDKEGVVQFDNVKVDNSKISLRSTSSRPSARMIGAIKMLESERLIRQFPWEQFIERGKSLETGERPLESADKLHKWQNGVSEEIPHPRDPWRRQGFPKIHYGRIAASNMLLKNPDVRDRLRLECNVIGVEMEGSGIADAAWNAGQHYLIIRGICDYCDEMKNDSWQGYAAVVAAAYARTLISRVSAISYSASLSPDTTLKAES